MATTTFWCELPLPSIGGIERRKVEFPEEIMVINSEVAGKILEEAPNVVAIDIPEGVGTIVANAFNCFKTSNLQRVTIPESVRRIYGSAFDGCEGLEVTVKTLNTDICWGAFPTGTRIVYVVT